jgi:hypothetical protein
VHATNNGDIFRERRRRHRIQAWADGAGTAFVQDDGAIHATATNAAYGVIGEGASVSIASAPPCDHRTALHAFA